MENLWYNLLYPLRIFALSLFGRVVFAFSMEICNKDRQYVVDGPSDDFGCNFFPCSMLVYYLCCILWFAIIP